MPFLRAKLKPFNRQGRISPGDFQHQFLNLILLILFMAGFAVLSPFPVSAQEQGTLLVRPPDTEGFPIISVRFKFRNDLHSTDHHLDKKQVEVFEDGKNVPLLTLEEAYSGIYFVLAINGGRELALRNESGTSVYDRLGDVLIKWGKSLPFSEGDTWSLITNEGMAVRHSIIPQVWADGLADHQPDFRNMTPDLSSLESAIRLAKERVVPFGVDKTLLYLSPPPAPEQIPALNALANEAYEAGIIVNVWMVGDSFYLSNDQGGALLNLAVSTAGQFFHYSGGEAIPNPDTYLVGLGSSHTLTYESSIRETGTYPLRIEVTHSNGTAVGENGPFYVAVRPPNPILISPPTVINRRPLAEGLAPTEQIFNFMVEFPDHHPREIVASRLLVNDVEVDARKDPPFDSLIWDLSAHGESGQHMIAVEVMDELGFSARTIQTPVEISVTPLDQASQMSGQKLGGVITGVILTGVLILSIGWLGRRVWDRRLSTPTGNFPVFSGLDPSSMDIPESRLPERVYGSLVPLTHPGASIEEGIIEITRKQARIGSNPQQADLLLAEIGVGRLQAELHFRQDGIWLRDLGSPLGTWVNYVQIGSQPVCIKPGDIIHFGEAGFRFTIKHDQKIANIKIEPYQPIL